MAATCTRTVFARMPSSSSIFLLLRFCASTASTSRGRALMGEAGCRHIGAAGKDHPRRSRHHVGAGGLGDEAARAALQAVDDDEGTVVRRQQRHRRGGSRLAQAHQAEAGQARVPSRAAPGAHALTVPPAPAFQDAGSGAGDQACGGMAAPPRQDSRSRARVARNSLAVRAKKCPPGKLRNANEECVKPRHCSMSAGVAIASSRPA